jgi:hypothetical protein
MLVVLLIWVACGVAGWKIGDNKGRPGLGAVLGFLLGLIGLLIVALIPSAQAARPQVAWAPPDAPPPPPTLVACPWCGQTMPAATTACPRCHGAVRATALLPPPDGTPASWLHDPSGRYAERYWDGSRWTDWTRNGNDYLTDPPVPSRAVSPGP